LSVLLGGGCDYYLCCIFTLNAYMSKAVRLEHSQVKCQILSLGVPVHLFWAGGAYPFHSTGYQHWSRTNFHTIKNST